MTHLFISYAHADLWRVERVARQLEVSGYKIWWDRHLHVGDEFPEVLERIIESASASLVLWSKSSCGSTFVKAEAYCARSNGNYFGVRLDRSLRLPLPFSVIHCFDLTDDGDQVWSRLLAELQRFIEKGKRKARLSDEEFERLQQQAFGAGPILDGSTPGRSLPLPYKRSRLLESSRTQEDRLRGKLKASHVLAASGGIVVGAGIASDSARQSMAADGNTHDSDERYDFAPDHLAELEGRSDLEETDKDDSEHVEFVGGVFDGLQKDVEDH